MRIYQLVESALLGLVQIVHLEEKQAIVLHNNKSHRVLLSDLTVLPKEFVMSHLQPLMQLWQNDNKVQFSFDDYVGHKNITDGYFTKSNDGEQILIVGGTPRQHMSFC